MSVRHDESRAGDVPPHGDSEAGMEDTVLGSRRQADLEDTLLGSRKRRAADEAIDLPEEAELEDTVLGSRKQPQDDDAAGSGGDAGLEDTVLGARRQESLEDTLLGSRRQESLEDTVLGSRRTPEKKESAPRPHPTGVEADASTDSAEDPELTLPGIRRGIGLPAWLDDDPNDDGANAAGDTTAALGATQLDGSPVGPKPAGRLVDEVPLVPGRAIDDTVTVGPARRSTSDDSEPDATPRRASAPEQAILKAPYRPRPISDSAPVRLPDVPRVPLPAADGLAARKQQQRRARRGFIVLAGAITVVVAAALTALVWLVLPILAP